MPKRLIGRGTQDWIALLPSGEENVVPFASPGTPTTITLTAAGTKGGTTLTISITPAFTNSSKKIPEGTYLLFTSSTGKEVVVQLDEDLVGATTAPTSMTVKPLPADIANGSTAPYPLRLKFRKSADLDRNVNLIKTSDFDSLGVARQIAVEIEQGLKLDGDYCALDPAYLTVEYAQQNFNFIYVWHVLPNPDSTIYSLGRQYSGVFAVGSMPLTDPADNIITSSITLAGDGLLTLTDPTPLT